MSRLIFLLCFKLIILAALSSQTLAQVDDEAKAAGAEQESEEKKEAESLKIEIADEPKTIDPAKLVFEPLAKKVTAEFDETSIRELVEWLRKEISISVLVDEAALVDSNILLSDPVTDRLTDEPVYLLLNRLAALDLGWYVEDDILRITTSEQAQSHFSTVPRNVGIFFDNDFSADRLAETIFMTIAPESWDVNGGTGTLVLLGDVMFVRQTDDVHRKVSGLLEALNTHGRRTFIDDPTQHESLREKLQENLTVDFDDTPLSEALATITEKTGAEIRIDAVAFRENRIREREPVSLKLTNQKMSSVLQALLARLKLTWTLRHGSILVTTEERTEDFLKTAVFDVRDLCRNFDESNALADALMKQTQESQWDESGGMGTITFAKPGVMVVSHKERLMNDVSQLLENYRTALKVSKFRNRDQDQLQKPLTLYYRMPTVVAEDLRAALPTLIEPQSWKNAKNPEATGTLLMLASRPELILAKGKAAKGGKEETEKSDGVLIGNSVLIIHQTVENHTKITDLIHNVESGNNRGISGQGRGGGGLGGGGGGFGGGFFSIQSE